MVVQHNKNVNYYLTNIIQAYKSRDFKHLKRKIKQGELWLNQAYLPEKNKKGTWKIKHSKSYQSFDLLIEIVEACNSHNIAELKRLLQHLHEIYRNKGWTKRKQESISPH